MNGSPGSDFGGSGVQFEQASIHSGGGSGGGGFLGCCCPVILSYRQPEAIYDEEFKLQESFLRHLSCRKKEDLDGHFSRCPPLLLRS